MFKQPRSCISCIPVFALILIHLDRVLPKLMTLSIALRLSPLLLVDGCVVCTCACWNISKANVISRKWNLLCCISDSELALSTQSSVNSIWQWWCNHLYRVNVYLMFNSADSTSTRLSWNTQLNEKYYLQWFFKCCLRRGFSTMQWHGIPKWRSSDRKCQISIRYSFTLRGI